ncbi:hypothetical protein L2E82_49836 [Cichorium intybus]|uniref:Uncharacterized protein n=1 Tax=Cichorium intybus TaxID=13427 RepID=A0ACB8Z153_CICIN|nr:hypothetical protein L2E82_49836 [Cichorium intybus]
MTRMRWEGGRKITARSQEDFTTVTPLSLSHNHTPTTSQCLNNCLPFRRPHVSQLLPLRTYIAFLLIFSLRFLISPKNHKILIIICYDDLCWF